MPLYTYDILPDGTATPTTGTSPTGKNGYRWFHFDLKDAELPKWVNAHLHPIPAGALLQTETRPRCDVHDGGLMLNLRGVNLNADGPADQMVAVRMWVTDQTVVTVRMRRVFAIEDLRQEIEAGAAPDSSAAFVETLASRLTERIQSTVFELADQVDDLEDAIHDDDDAPLPENLASLRRTAIRLRRYLGPQRDALMALAATDTPLGNNALHRRELANLAMLTVEELDSLQGRLTAINDHHAAQAAAAQNRNSYILSIVAATFLPLGFITGLFGVNVGGMPGVDSPAAFAILCLSMLGITLMTFVVMRWFKWI
ncbi:MULTISPECIES: zinc transporter ZntB [Roseobacteraceae]|uniref:Zinc transport protein ZntB n=1 Tax=Pseudosulfitobacter pseudonitzschiae TaxID=1402135 RepID=A0A221K5E0_9RHOB|nr:MULTISPECIES: zinc transporter ZntB [Roseobacteraceae]ASM74228.1 zinc transport protein ZntB [Pseudosulfitobacter pseudonitzschiae]